MTNDNRYGELSDAKLQELHGICARFEKSLQDSDRSAIEDLIADVASELKRPLFLDLLDIEIGFRTRHNESPDTSEYLARFPDQESEIEHAFKVLRTSRQSPADQETRMHDSDNPDAAESGTTDHTGIASGVQIGPYKLLQPIGEGGMGSVWMAEQKAPVRRTVALKIIKAGMDTREVIARFEAERQALAMMNHPNIAKVLDVGETSQGRPYFVMELVQGVPITKYCDKGRMPTVRRLLLFSAVCRAVQHAHQKGIIHRDIKPSNVLVGEQDGEPIVKVIDFGLAKATGQSLTEKTIFTVLGQLVGTPTYMSPEQADGGLDIDTRTDVYSLGVLLYELLTGVTPIDAQQLRAAGLAEIQRIIREVDAPSMSQRVSAVGEQSQANAENRATDSKNLKLILRGDLDLIVKKSLEKDRNRRYDSPSSFAADIQRFLDSEPVEASPPSARYRLQKFVYRNRTGVIAASAVLAALVLGLIGTSYGLFRAEQSRQVASDRADGEAIAKQEAQRAAESERSAKLEAQANFGRAREAVDRYFTRVSESKLLDVPGLQPLRKELLQDALDYYTSFIDDHGDSSDLLKDLALAQNKMGVITAMIGSQEDALAAHLNAYETLLSLPPALQSDAKHRLAIASTLNKIGKLQFLLGRVEEATASTEKALEVSQLLADERSDDRDAQFMLSRAQQSLGILYMKMERRAEARACMEQAVSIVENLEAKSGGEARSDADAEEVNRYLAGYIGDLAVALDGEGLAAEALQAQERSIKVFRSLVDNPEATLSDRDELARRTYNIANFYRRAGRMNEAETAMLESCDQYRGMIIANPTITEYRIGLAYGVGGLGVLNGMQGRHDKALEYFTEAMKVYEKIVLINPDDVEIRLGLGMMINNVGKEQEFAGNMDAAIESSRQAIAVFRELIKDNPRLVDVQDNLGVGLQNLALNLCKADRQKDALPVFVEAQTIREELVAGSPGNAYRHSDLAAVLHAQGTALTELDRRPESEKYFRDAISQQQKAITIRPEGTPFLVHMAHHYDSLVGTLQELERIDDALEACREIRKLGSAAPDHLYRAAGVYCLAATVIEAGKDELTEDELAAFEQHTGNAIATLTEAIAAGWDDMDRMKQDEDLNVLKDLDAFKALLNK